MPCYRPLHGWRAHTRNPSGKRGIVFDLSKGHSDQPLSVPCGQCIGCRLERSRQWAIRCVHEASLHESSLFLTLTYDNKHLPGDQSLNKKHFQEFMKTLRHAHYRKRRTFWEWDPILLSNRHQPLRYFHCGEYGENLSRPHYHACLFNADFADKYVWQTKHGVKLYVSETLNRLWGKGYCVIGDVTFDSAAYVARYITKKITGDAAPAHYSGKEPEYTTMSRRPGIGKAWIDKFLTDTYPRDSVVMRGREFKPPKYYDKQFELDSSEAFAQLKNKRKALTLDPWDPENSTTRLIVKETVQILNLANSRSYEK